MKKQLVVCLFVLLMLCAFGSALADHKIEATGETCPGGTYTLVDKNATQHKVHCDLCDTDFWEDHSSTTAATCTKKAVCDFCGTEFGELASHDLVHHDGKAPTCTEAGWKEYYTCNNCDYTTYEELPAAHDYTEKVVEPTCTKDGYTLHTCKNCDDSYKDKPTKKLLHWFGEWTSNGNGTHSATCRREGCKHVSKANCAAIEFKQNETVLTLCPVCGEVSDGTVLARVEEAKAEGKHLPQGELTLRLGKAANGDTLLSVGFEYAGKLTQPKGEVKVTMPAKLLDGVTLAQLNADGTEAELPFTVTDEDAVFTLDFTDSEIPAAVVRLVPVVPAA